MVDYADSSQFNSWLFSSPDELALCRAKANRLARQHLASIASSSTTQVSGTADDNNNNNETTTVSPDTVKTTTPTANLPVEHFACGFRRRVRSGQETIDIDIDATTPPLDDFLTPQEEATLVSFYVSRVPDLIGPAALLPRLRRDSKVTATACLFLRRFFLSNSVLLYDPKIIMTAAVFLAAKTEDAMTDVRYLEEGTAVMSSPVTIAEIIPAELSLLSGLHFDLLCFHPYQAVLALTEDLRTYLKSDKGKALVQSHRSLSGQDLKPIYDAARLLLDEVVVSDIPLLYSPGQIALAAWWVAQERVYAAADRSAIPTIDLRGYIKQRFDHPTILPNLCEMLRGLREGRHGCCRNTSADMVELKAIHKKLKKVRAWGKKEKKNTDKRKNKPAGSNDDADDTDNEKKRQKL